MVPMMTPHDSPNTITCPGGANVPALNDLLAPFGIAFGDAVIHGSTNIALESVQVIHGKQAKGSRKEPSRITVYLKCHIVLAI